MSESLDIQASFDKLRTMYNSEGRTFNVLVYGREKTGKTFAVRTAPAPILFHSFDPGGTTSIRDEIDSGRVIADTSFETEDPKAPTAYGKWVAEFERLKRSGIFNHIATFVIDSGSTFSDAMLAWVMWKEGKLGKNPEHKEWGINMAQMIASIRQCQALPCNFIFNCHIQIDQDSLTSKIEASPVFIGKLKSRVPPLFDEIYITKVKDTPKGPEYKFLTQPDSYYMAGSRLSNKGQLSKEEPQNYKEILKKAGLPYEDKPLFLPKTTTP